VLEVLFWLSAGLILYTHLGYPFVLWVLTALARSRRGPAPGGEPPSVSLIVAAHNEEAVIERRVENALALDYPRERLEVIVASDGSDDRTVEAAERAGADLVLDVGRGGKVRAQNAAVERARGEILAFSDANSFWAPSALRRLVRPFDDPDVGYVCGQVRFVGGDGSNQEGAYWRFELAVRALESRLGGITAGNGAIYATRSDAYLRLDPRVSHDLSFPFNLVKRGWRPVYEPSARADEKMVPSVEGEFRRKRRMFEHAWPIVLRGGMLSPRGYGPLYAFQIASHRLLRYATPLLHLVALGTNVALLGEGVTYTVTLALQGALLAGALLAPLVPLRPLRIARYYVLMTASIAAGLWDHLRTGTPAEWERAEGTR
jgi:cellulose synthase/poly-beta-1,6-N-acetylglucosamine synthase-like glycosyltransferase